MRTIGTISALYYTNLIQICEKYKIAFNLDIETPSRRIFREKALMDFLSENMMFAIRSASGSENAHVGISQKAIEGSNLSKVTVRFSSKKALDPQKKQELLDRGYEVRSRFGYDTFISIKI